MKAARLALICATLGTAGSWTAQASFRHRQYYETTWAYSQANNYYYVNYYYTTTPAQATYNYHYCIYYPSRPRYIYYYNPVSQVYWGRYEIGSKGENRYSMLDEKDRKKDIDAIPESAFPAPGRMPQIPGVEDGLAIEPPPENVPKGPK